MSSKGGEPEYESEFAAEEEDAIDNRDFSDLNEVNFH